jgi:hypothetical protein
VSPEKPMLNAIQSIFIDTTALIKGLPDRQAAFEAATRLAEFLRSLSEEAFELRPQIAVEILESERLSLTGLAAKIGVSKARANQMVQQTRTRKG